MRALVVYNTQDVTPSGDQLCAAADLDVLAQVELVEEAFRVLGIESQRFPIGLDFSELYSLLSTRQYDAVFNLVESLAGTDRLQPLAPLLFESLGIPYSGCTSATLVRLQSKLSLHAALHAAAIPSPLVFTAELLEQTNSFSSNIEAGCEFIFKPVYEHASRGISDSSVRLIHSIDELTSALQQEQQRQRLPLIAQEFIDGRELNVSLLYSASDPGSVSILPIAEIDFSSFPKDKPRIVGSEAKWAEHSFEFQNTPRRFLNNGQDSQLLSSVESVARQCWSLFGLRGFARIDFRIDAENTPWVIDINPNPCLSADAGFYAALTEADIPFALAVQRIFEASAIL